MDKQYLEILKDLIVIKSTADNPEGLLDAVKYVEDFFKNTKAFVNRYDKNGIPSIVIANSPGLVFDVIMLGHLDVVPASEKMFTPQIKGGKLYGRGACDMKVGDAVMMQIMKKILESKADIKVALMFTTDEEANGDDGAGHLVDEIGYRSKFVLVPDGGLSPDEAVIANKGALHLKITVPGKTAHGSRPWLGDNAAEKAFNIFTKIKKKIEGVPVKKNGIKYQDKESKYWKNTCVLGVIKSGEAVNQIPGSAEMFIDIRFIEGSTYKNLLEKINTLAKDCKIEVLTETNPRFLDKENEYLKIYLDSAKSALGKKCRVIRTHGSDDGRYFSRHGIPTLCSRPLCGAQHSEEEWVDIKSIDTFYNIYKNFFIKLSNKDKS